MHAAVLRLSQAAVSCLPLTTLRAEALINPKTSNFFQKRHEYTGIQKHLGTVKPRFYIVEMF